MAWAGYKELVVWQKAMALTNQAYRLIRKLPREETYALADQMRRCAVSIPSNIAEGHGRQSTKEFSRFLSIANGSCMELETQFLICEEQGYLAHEEVEAAADQINEISRMLTALILRLRENPRENGSTSPISNR